MESESDSYEGMKAKTGEEKEQEVVVADGCEEKLGSCKESPHLLTDNNSRHATPGPTAVTPSPDQLTIFYGGKVLVFDAIPAEKAQEIMRIATAAAAAVKPRECEVKNNGSGSPADKPALTRSASLLSTASPQAQLYPMHQGSGSPVGAPILSRSASMLSAASPQAQLYPMHQGSGSPVGAPVLSRSASMLSAASPPAPLYPMHQGSGCKLQAGTGFPIQSRHSLQRFFEKRRDRLVSKSPYPAPPAAKVVDSKEPNLSAETSPDTGCSEKSVSPLVEPQPKVAANLA